MAESDRDLQELSAIEKSRLLALMRVLRAHFGVERAEQITGHMESAAPHRRPELDDNLKPEKRGEK